jgi:hypothetical protein
VTCEPHSYLILSALSLCTDTYSMRVRKKICSNYVENMRRNRIKFIRRGDQECWICTPLDSTGHKRTHRYTMTLVLLIAVPTEWQFCNLDREEVLLLHKPTCLHKVSELHHMHFGFWVFCSESYSIPHIVPHYRPVRRL